MDYGATSPVERHSPWLFIPTTAKSTPQCPNCRPRSCHSSLRQTCWCQLSMSTLAATVYPLPQEIGPSARLRTSSSAFEDANHTIFWFQIVGIPITVWVVVVCSKKRDTTGYYECFTRVQTDCPSNFLQVLGEHKISHDSWIHVTTPTGLDLVYVRSHTFSCHSFNGTQIDARETWLLFFS